MEHTKKPTFYLKKCEAVRLKKGSQADKLAVSATVESGAAQDRPPTAKCGKLAKLWRCCKARTRSLKKRLMSSCSSRSSIEVLVSTGDSRRDAVDHHNAAAASPCVASAASVHGNDGKIQAQLEADVITVATATSKSFNLDTAIKLVDPATVDAGADNAPAGQVRADTQLACTRAKFECMRTDEPTRLEIIDRLRKGTFGHVPARRRAPITMGIKPELTVAMCHKAVDLPSAKSVVLQVCKALDFMHKANIFHGRLSADMLLLEANDQVRVKLPDDGSCALQEMSRRPLEGVLGLETTPAVDLWAVGLVFFELVTHGTTLFEASASDEAHLAQMIDLFGPVPSHLADLGTLNVADEVAWVPGRNRLGKRLRRQHGFQDVDAAKIAMFVSMFLTYSPRARITAEEASSLPWLQC